MATYAYTFTSGDTLTPTKLNSARTVSEIVNADIKSDAAIAGSKLADGAITNAKVDAAAAIAGTKIAPDFGSQNVVTTGSVTAKDVTSQANDASAALYASRASADGGPPYVVFDKARGSLSSKAVVQSGDQCGQILFRGYDGSTTASSAAIACYVDGTPGANDMPGRLSFWTTADGSSTLTERMRITSDGEVYIAGTTDRGAYNLQCNGTGVWGAGAYVNGSDERLKENIAEITEGLEVVNKLRPVSFNYKPEHSKDTSKQAGFIAQELLVALEGQDYLEGTVSQGPDYYNVAYQNLIPVLAKAIQELSAKVAALEAA